VNAEKFDLDYNPDKDNPPGKDHPKPGFSNTGGTDFEGLFYMKRMSKQISKLDRINKEEDHTVPKSDRSSTKWTNSEKSNPRDSRKSTTSSMSSGFDLSGPGPGGPGSISGRYGPGKSGGSGVTYTQPGSLGPGCPNPSLSVSVKSNTPSNDDSDSGDEFHEESGSTRNLLLLMRDNKQKSLQEKGEDDSPRSSVQGDIAYAILAGFMYFT
jgi:hypothetical protein